MKQYYIIPTKRIINDHTEARIRYRMENAIQILVEMEEEYLKKLMEEAPKYLD